MFVPATWTLVSVFTVKRGVSSCLTVLLRVLLFPRNIQLSASKAPDCAAAE